MADAVSGGAAAPPAAELEWPEPIQRVQDLAGSGIKSLPPRYIKPPHFHVPSPSELPPPVVDFSSLDGGAAATRLTMQQMQVLSSACREWGVFQIVNHGISHQLLTSAMSVSRSFFTLPMKEKLRYANDPVTYVGYGSRMGVQKGISLDWNDYFFHHLHPFSATNNLLKWPDQPSLYRKIIKEYGESIFTLSKTLLSIFTKELDLPEGSLLESFGGEDGMGTCFRMNYYPKCPQPELALGLSPHTDPGCFTFILQDQVSGLQVNKDGVWTSVPPIQNALVVIIGDQLEIVSNGLYKSVDHRTRVSGDEERMSLVVFVNPDGNKRISPMEEVVARSGVRVYDDMTFNDYRKIIRTQGVQGKAILATRATKSNPTPI